ncbi:MAG: hypothetical protein RL748_1937 [Pseudomonadota bacterium]
MVACNLLPRTGTQHCLGKVLCTLVFVKVWSDVWQRESASLQGQGQTPEQIAATLVQRGMLAMDAASVFDACRSQPPMPGAPPIRDAVSHLARANPVLQQALNPLQFGYVAGLYANLQADPAKLGQIVDSVGKVSFEHVPSCLPCGREFTEVISFVCANTQRPIRAVAPLIAKLMQPQANQLALDFACGQGHLLWALAAELAQHQPQASLQLHGMESDHGQWALATMLFSLSGLDPAQLHNSAALNTAFTRMDDADKANAIGSADMVVMALPDTTQAWNHALAHQERDPRFTRRPPYDSRVALAWLGLAALKPEGGRMALVMPAKALEGQEGLALRKHLVEMNLLDAVITMPVLKRQVLLLIRTQKAHTNVAFMQITRSGEAGLDDASEMALAWQRGQAQAKQIIASITTLAKHQYPMDLLWYKAPDSVRLPKAPRSAAS